MSYFLAVLAARRGPAGAIALGDRRAPTDDLGPLRPIGTNNRRARQPPVPMVICGVRQLLRLQLRVLPASRRLGVAAVHLGRRRMPPPEANATVLVDIYRAPLHGQRRALPGDEPASRRNPQLRAGVRADAYEIGHWSSPAASCRILPPLRARFPSATRSRRPDLPGADETEAIFESPQVLR